MPEGPEIWRAAGELADVLTNQRLTHAEFTQSHLRHWGKRLMGQMVCSVQARGKAIVTRFENNHYLYSHNQLYGLWMITRSGQLPDTTRALRVALHTRTHSALLYSASEIELLDDVALGSHPYLEKLGPEALDPDVPWRSIAERLQHPAFNNRRLASLYLDQHFVAGIGNYLRSEILFDAQLHPLRRPKELTRGELGKLARSTLKITRRSLHTQGVTNPPARAARLRKQGLEYEAYRFAVFARADLPCYVCRKPITRVTLSSRRLYLCPTCQPEPLM